MWWRAASCLPRHNTNVPSNVEDTNDTVLCLLSLTSGPDPLAGVFRKVVTAATFPECRQTREQISVTCQKLAFH